MLTIVGYQFYYENGHIFLQVIDWLDNHGDIFLKKNTSIGRSLQRSRALQKSHEHFESVAKVSTCTVS